MGSDLIAYDIIYLILKDFLKSKLTVSMVLLCDKLSDKLQLLGLLSDGKRIVIYFPDTVIGANVFPKTNRVFINQDWFKQPPFEVTTIDKCLDTEFISSILSKIQVAEHSTSLSYDVVTGIENDDRIKLASQTMVRNKFKEFVTRDLTSITYCLIFDVSATASIIKAISLCKHVLPSRMAVLITTITDCTGDNIGEAFECPGAIFTLFKTGEILSKRFIANLLEEDIGGRTVRIKAFENHYHLTPQQVKELTDEFPSKYYKFRGIDVEE